MSRDDNRYTGDTVDTRVSDAYRNLATEKTPPDLDTAILAESRRQTGTTRTGFARWRRPLAWVTMIALSFAIVLEFNQAPPVPGPDFDETKRQDAPAAADIADSEQLQKSAATSAEAEKRSRDEELSTMSAPAATSRYRSNLVPVAVPETATTIDTSGITSADASREAAADTSSDTSEDQRVDACDADARATPERWRACILELMEAGLTSAVTSELNLYRETFPAEPLPRPPQ